MKNKKRRTSAYAAGAKSVVVVLLLGPAWPCTAAEWSVEPVINMMYENNDNRSLTTARHKTTTGYVADVSLPFAIRAPVSEIQLTPRVRSQRYDDSRLDSNDYYLNLQSRLEAPRTRWQLDATRSWATTLTTEFQDIGLVDVQRQRNGTNLYPSVTRNLTERTTFRIVGVYEGVSYDDVQGTGLVDTTYSNVDTTLTYKLTERTSLNLTGYYSKLDAAQIGNQTRNTGGQLGLDYRFSEPSRLTLSYGSRRTDSEITNSLSSSSDSSNGQIYSAGWSYQGEASKWNLSFGRSVLPSGFGFLVERNEARATYDQSLNERASVQFKLLAFQHRGVSASATTATVTDDRDYTRADAGLRWGMSPFWALSATYVYAWQEFLNSTRPARSNALFLGISYSGQQHSWSR